MSTTTLTRTVTGATPASVTLRSLVRTDTGDAVTVTPSLPQPFADAGGGAYTFTFTDPAVDLTYRWVYRVTFSTGQFYEDQVESAGTATSGFTGRYTSTAKLRLFLATVQADFLSNPNGGSANTPTPDYDGYEFAVRGGDARLDALAAMVPLVTPMTFVSGSPFADIVSRDATVLATQDLHWKRAMSKETQNAFTDAVAEVVARWTGWIDNAQFIPAGYTAPDAAHDFRVLTTIDTVRPTVDLDGREVTPSNQRWGPYWDGNLPGYRPGRG